MNISEPSASKLQAIEYKEDRSTFSKNETIEKNRIELNKKSLGVHTTPSRILVNYIFKTTSNKWYVRLGLFAIILQIAIFKYFYPSVGFINGDSYVYLETAYHNLSINTYPIGYSMFLRLFSILTKSDVILFCFQYLLVQLSVLSFIFTLFYFYNPAPITKVCLFSFMILNPATLYLANYVSSDSFFLSLSMIWFTQLFWIINLPTERLILLNAVTLFLTFTVRYNALFYPILSIVALFQGRNKTWYKIGGLAISFLLIAIFIEFSSSQYYKLTGHRQFTPFTGWQTANNAMYAYRFVDSTHHKKPPKQFQELDNMVRNYFDSTRDIRKHPQEALLASTVYMWSSYSPLSIYRENIFKKDTTASALKKWATVAPIMANYGTYLIRAYPKEYIKYYLFPNALKYYAPPVEFLEYYSTGVDSVNLMAQIWFNYKTNKLKTRLADFKVSTLNFFPVFTGTMNIVLLFSLLSFIILKGYKKYPRLNNGMFLLISLWMTNFAFSVLASPIALRFQLFPILVSFAFASFLLDYLVRAAYSAEGENRAQNPEKI